MISGEVIVMEAGSKVRLICSVLQEHIVVISEVGKNVCQSVNDSKYVQVWKSTIQPRLSKWKRKFTKPCITQDCDLSYTVKTPCP